MGGVSYMTQGQPLGTSRRGSDVNIIRVLFTFHMRPHTLLKTIGSISKNISLPALLSASSGQTVFRPNTKTNANFFLYKLNSLYLMY